MGGVAGGVRIFRDTDVDDAGGSEVPVVTALEGEDGVDETKAPLTSRKNPSRTEIGQ